MSLQHSKAVQIPSNSLSNCFTEIIQIIRSLWNVLWRWQQQQVDEMLAQKGRLVKHCVLLLEEKSNRSGKKYYVTRKAAQASQ